MNKQRILASSKFACASLFCLLPGGCSFIQAPEPEPLPKEEKMPPPDFFDETANITKGIDLGGTWQIVLVNAGDLVTIRSVVPQLDKDGQPMLNSAKQPIVTVGQPETVRIAGVLVAAPGQRGAQGAADTVRRWTMGKTDLKVEQDPVYPTDPAGHRNVQIYFKGTSEATKEKVYNLNRMLVRSGFAVVDLHQPSSIKPEAWLSDEQYARLRIDPKDPEGKRIAPLGLWKLGIILGERQAPPRTLKPKDSSPAGSAPATPAPASGAAPSGASPGRTAPIGGAPTTPNAAATP